MLISFASQKCSQGWFGLYDIGLGRKCSLGIVYSIKHLRRCIWCSLRLTWCHAFWASHKLDYLCQQGLPPPPPRAQYWYNFNFMFAPTNWMLIVECHNYYFSPLSEQFSVEKWVCFMIFCGGVRASCSLLCRGIDFMRPRISFYLQCAALMTLIFVIVLNLAIGILPHVDNFAHIGGFISGFLLGFVVLIRPQFGWVNQRHQYTRPGSLPGSPSPRSKHNACQYILWIVAAIVLIIGQVIFAFTL